jgi:[calcium/calmodulin-dependent protein kinase] kinase
MGFAYQRVKEAQDALYLIREEVAIMKKLNHPNLVQLIEVLDDPEEDTLYMVMEMCKKGVVMKVGLGESANPYPEETCRHWFRDLILGIEYRESSVTQLCLSEMLMPQLQYTRKGLSIATLSPRISCSPMTTS